MFPVLHLGAVPLPAAHLLAHNVSTHINVTKGLLSIVMTALERFTLYFD